MSKKLLILTGGSHGIGKSTAEIFLNEGYDVLNISRTPCPVKGVQNLPIDLSDPQWPTVHQDDFAPHLTNQKICLIHNAARLEKDTIESLKADTLREVLEVNVVAPLLLNQIVLPYMEEGSSILYVGSTLSEKAVKGAASYVTSKHALLGLMRSTCQDLAGRSIHTACICPGFTDTEMLRKHLNNDGQVLKAIASNVSFNRLIEPREIAQTLLFCAQTPVINGSVLHANLGQIES